MVGVNGSGHQAVPADSDGGCGIIGGLIREGVIFDCFVAVLKITTTTTMMVIGDVLRVKPSELILDT
eukprot:291738-Rhodomonas_salina.1